jgi:excisionase family DNA binding protein
MQRPAMSKIMTATEVARYLGLNVGTVYNYAAKGRIPAFRVGKQLRFEKDKIDAYMESRGIDRKGGRSETKSP